MARTIIHIHALLMSLWVVLFIAQVFFIRTVRIKTHQLLGFAAIALGIGIVISGWFTAIARATRTAMGFLVTARTLDHAASR